MDQLSARITALDLAAKRALFAERVDKPVFFDTAFNYVELPLDELLVRAGKQPSAPVAAPAQSSVAAAAQNVAKSVANVAPAPVASAVRGIARATRESTPAVQISSRSGRQQDADEDDEEDEPQEQKKGWLGGWFARK